MLAPPHICFALILFLALNVADPAIAADGDGIEFFEKKIRPVLATHCYKCHSEKAQKIKGSLALDSAAGILKGGDRGPAIVPGKPDQSMLIKAIRHVDAAVQMPKDAAKLDAAVIDDLVNWVAAGAPLPRDPPSSANAAWEELYQARLKWWSLQPVRKPPAPTVKKAEWCNNDIDRIILKSLENNGLAPAPSADPRTLARRLSFALTGLPPKPEEIEQFVRESATKPQVAYAALVDRLLASPYFGERWARHWMDVMHYADTHGYEWDHPAKNAWLYRDYLIRAFNADVSYKQLVLEHIAGDLLKEPRLEYPSVLNESMIGTAALRLGERRHGDSAEFEGIHQEAIDNVIDTVSKAFLATTVACSRCHDHKLDAIAQRDYYALYGVFMSSRWVSRVADGQEWNAAARSEMKRLKKELRPKLADAWLAEVDALAKSDLWQKLGSNINVPRESLLYPWAQIAAADKRGENIELAWQNLAAEYAKLRRERLDANAKNTRVIADFTTGRLPAGWIAEGYGLKEGFVRDGDFVVAGAGPQAVRHLLPAGLYTHSFSPRLGGALRSPLLGAGRSPISRDDTAALTFHVTAGDLAASHVVVDNAMFPESRYRFLDYPNHGSLTVSTLPEEIRKGRRIYIELNTKAFNNYYPPRTGLVARYKTEQQDDPRSWFGVTKVYAGPPPQDELRRFEILFMDRLFNRKAPLTLKEASDRLITWIALSLQSWKGEGIGENAENVVLINELLKLNLISNRSDATPHIAELIRDYRIEESRLKPERTIGSIADFHEGRDDRIALRGSYTDLGEAAPRGNLRMLDKFSRPVPKSHSGRLELAESIVDSKNPLTARVFVNRVWHYLFGSGLVQSVDDFGHLGEQPSHPELLDYLAAKFVEEGWSTKKLIREMVLSSTWRQSGSPDPKAIRKDPENRLWHHYPLRRLEAEAIRDSMLAASGRLDATLYGLPIDPYRRSEDKDKRLFSGPLDGDGRRSIYTKMTLMEPPKFLALFNQPIPKITVGRRDVTNVPDQALALLNDPFVIGQAEFWAKKLISDKAANPDERIRMMFLAALGRSPEAEELKRFRALLDHSAELRKVPPADLLKSQSVWQDLAHAMFNLKEFIYVR